MAKSLAVATRNLQADIYADQLDNGYLRIYGGSVPANADAALGGATLLAELRFSATSAPAASGGVVTMSAITPDASTDAAGTATFYRTFKADGTTVVEQGTVGTSSADLIVPTTTVVLGIEFRVTSFAHTVP